MSGPTSDGKLRAAFAAAVLASTLALAGCATPYQRATATALTGGYTDKHIEGDVWRVEFGANGFATRETAQTYWLYRCAELTLEQGFEYFELLSPVELGMQLTPEQLFGRPDPVRKTKGGYVYVPMYYEQSYKPYLVGDILLRRAPFEPKPPKSFDARKLKEALDPFVKPEKKCSEGNVCPHAKPYLGHPVDEAGKSST